MLEGRALGFAYPGRPLLFSGLDLSVGPGEVVGLAGLSGAGKSTLGRVLAGYLAPTTGTVTVGGIRPATGPSPVQYVHQSSILSVDPRWRIGRIIEEGWVPDPGLCEALGVSRAWYDRYPHEVSGGELQRVALLRALGPATRYLVADEMSAMLDPVSQVDIWQALLARCRETGLGILAISHNPALLGRVSTRRLTMQAGQIARLD